MAPRAVPESRAPGRTALDLRGTALATASLTAVVLPLVDGRALGWPLWSWASLVTVAELSVEAFFPADDSTAAALRG